MRKLFILAILLLFVTVGFSQKKKFVTIKGSVTGDTKGANYIYFYAGGVPADSVRIKNGKFKTLRPFTETHILSAVTQYDKIIKQAYRAYYLLIDGSGNINIDMDIEKGLSFAKITGSTTAISYQNFTKQRDSVYIKIAGVLKSLYGKSYVPQTDPLSAKVSVSRDSLSKSFLGSLLIDFVGRFNNEYVGLYVLNTDGKDALNIDLLEKSFNSLSERIQQMSDGQNLASYIHGLKNTNIGDNVKNFVLNDQNGDSVTLNQFRGKYVWIDFWASWCGPCKQAFPHMKDVYAKYKDKGLEILGISADSKIDPWLKILPTLKNPWKQLWDDKGVMFQFAVTALPTSFLIDPNGKIVLKEIGYEPNGSSALDKKLAEIFDR